MPYLPLPAVPGTEGAGCFRALFVTRFILYFGAQLVELFDKKLATTFSLLQCQTMLPERITCLPT